MIVVVIRSQQPNFDILFEKTALASEPLAWLRPWNEIPFGLNLGTALW
jgi:hypothetical protein